MTESEFDQQIWRRYDTVTLDTGVRMSVSYVCFGTRSVRVYLKDQPPEWMRCERIMAHASNGGGAADDIGLVEELHNKIMELEDRLKEQKDITRQLEEKLRNDHVAALLKNVNIIMGDVREKQKRTARLDACMTEIEELINNIKK